MSSTKITDLPVLTTPSANGANTVFVVVDKSSGTFTTKQLTLGNLDIAIDNVASFAYTTANAAYDKANSANVIAQGGFDKANSANVLAQAAFDKANTDTTTISTTAGVYGNATHVAVITVAANGRVSSVTNTAITGFANATYDQAGFDKANSANVLAQAAFDTANTATTTGQAAFDAANSATTTAQAGFNKANSANTLAQAGYDAANASSTLAQNAYDAANTNGSVFNTGAFDKANSANVLAQAAFDTANTANSTDYTTISITAGAHGNATYVPVITLTANGRVSAISNTAITGFVPTATGTATFNQANAAFDQANTANVTAQAGFNKANSANVLAQAAYDYANTISGSSGSFISWIGNTANSAFSHANGSFVTGNSALSLAALSFNTANAGVLSAQSAFDKANAANTLAQTARDSANVANTLASSINVQLTTLNTFANSSFDKANLAYTTAQTSFNQANTAYDKANTVETLAQAAYNQANTASVINTQSQAAYDQANTASNTAVYAAEHANSAYDVANTALTTAAIAINFDNQANAAYDAANAATTLAQNAYNASNTANSWANTVVLVTAQAAFDRSNTNLTSIELGLYPKLNSAYDQANTANGRAFTSVQKGGDTMTGPLTITTNAIIGFTVTSNTSNTIGGATNPVVEMTGKANNYIQTYLYNETDEKYSSADFVAYPHNGSDANGWIDMGITSLSFDYPTFSITGGNEGYIFMSAPNGSGTSGNLVIATDSTGTDNAIEFYVGGFDQSKANASVTIKQDELLLRGNLTFGDATTQTGASISLVDLQAIVANAATWGDFQTAIAAL